MTEMARPATAIFAVLVVNSSDLLSGAYNVVERQVIGGLSSAGAVGATFPWGWNYAPNLQHQRGDLA
jgi:hypothetical protein